jgi:hypothetical protein
MALPPSVKITNPNLHTYPTENPFEPMLVCSVCSGSITLNTGANNADVFMDVGVLATEFSNKHAHELETADSQL